MNRSKPMQRTELNRGTKGLQRSGLRRGVSSLRRGVSLRLVSTSRQAAPKSSRKPDVPARTRREVKERDGYSCVAGGCWIGEHGGHVHHRLKRSQGGDHSLPNLILLCEHHHSEVHRLTGLAYRLGYLVRRGVDPASVPIESAWPGGVAA